MAILLVPYCDQAQKDLSSYNYSFFAILLSKLCGVYNYLNNGILQKKLETNATTTGYLFPMDFISLKIFGLNTMQSLVDVWVACLQNVARISISTSRTAHEVAVSVRMRS